LPKPNYQFEKRKRDLDKKAKKEAKKLKKQEATQGQPTENTDLPG